MNRNWVIASMLQTSLLLVSLSSLAGVALDDLIFADSFESIEITLESPSDGSLTNRATQDLVGYLSEPGTLMVDAQSIDVDDEGRFADRLLLAEGVNDIELIARSLAGNKTARLSVRVTVDSQAPDPIDVALVTLNDPASAMVQIDGDAGSANPLVLVTIMNLRTGEAKTVSSNGAGEFATSLGGEVGDSYRFVASDEAGNESPPRDKGSFSSSVACGTEPDVSLRNAYGVTSLYDATQFLYTGPNRVQGGLTFSAIEPERAALVSGRVTNTAGQPLCARVSVLYQPELGDAISRSDGFFDLVVNGAEQLTVQFEREGYLPMQRTLSVPWAEYSVLGDIVMTELDPQVTTVDLTAPVLQVAPGSISSDTDGDRQAVVLFPAGTTAEMLFPDGSAQAISTLNVRATEYTVGDTGPAAMPAELPSSSGYTYAVELSVDEALAAGAVEVRFSQALPVFVDNFLGFPVGGIVPVGWYDRLRGVWVPSNNGRVIEILGTDGQGRAELDVDGSGMAAGQAALDELGISNAELEELADRYAVDDSVWRFPVTHFTPWDANWPYGPQDGDIPPDEDAELADDEAPDPDENCKQAGCIIDTQAQVLTEQLDVVGTPYFLTYRSDRLPGSAARRTIDIPLSGSTVPQNLLGIELFVNVGGRVRLLQFFSNAPNQQTTFLWDGLDGFGREVVGDETVEVITGYRYAGVYYDPAESDPSFGAFSPTAQNILPGPRRTFTMLNRTQLKVGKSAPITAGLGGWTVNVHHAYDANSKTLYLGDGNRTRGEKVAAAIEVFAGTGEGSSDPDDAEGPALDVAMTPLFIVWGPDGSMFYSDTRHDVVSRIDPLGQVTIVAGDGTSCTSVPITDPACGDGPDATQTGILPGPLAVGPDGSIYLGETLKARIRRIAPDGSISTIAGTGSLPSNPNEVTGDGGPAIEAPLRPRDLTIGPDNNLYVVDNHHHAVRKIDADGIITSVAGTGIRCASATASCGDDGPAAGGQFNLPSGIAFGPDGSLYVADNNNHRIRRISPQGIIGTIAGTGIPQVSEDGIPAATAGVNFPGDIASDAEGNIYFWEASFLEDSWRIRKIGTNGIIETVAGTGKPVSQGDGNDLGGRSALAAAVSVSNMEIGPDGDLYFSTWARGNRIYKITEVLPGFAPDETVIAGPEGEEVFVFDRFGRHLKTVHALTGGTLAQFEYTSEGVLSEIADAYGAVTAIARDGASNPTGIIGPDGHTTLLGVDANGFLNAVTNPASESHVMEYNGLGLMTRHTNPRSDTALFDYDSLGRLREDTNFGGGGWDLERVESGEDYTVTVTSAAGREYTYEVQALSNGARRQISTTPDGRVTDVLLSSAEQTITTASDGTQTLLGKGPDPRFGMSAPIPELTSVMTPGGIEQNTLAQRSIELLDPADPLSVDRLEDTLEINGRIYQSRYDRLTRTWTYTSPEGRIKRTTLNDLGRPVRMQDGDWAPAITRYDARGRIAAHDQGSGPTARTTTLDYYDTGPLAGFLRSTTDPLNRETTFEYDAAGRLTRETQPGGNTFEFDYDANGNLSSVTPPGQPSHTLAYTALNALDIVTPPDVGAGNTSTTYSYNLDNQLTLVTRPDGSTIEYRYAPGGQLSELVIPRGTITTTYDNVTRKLESVSSPEGNVTSFSYDGFLMTGTDWSGDVIGSVERGYNNDLLTTQWSVNGDALTFDYDNDGLMVRAGALVIDRDPANWSISGATLDQIQSTASFNDFGELAGSETVRPVTGGQEATLTEIDAQIALLGQTYIVAELGNDLDLLISLASQLPASSAIDAFLTELDRLQAIADAEPFETEAGPIIDELRSLTQSLTPVDGNSEVVYAETFTRDDLGRISQKVERIEGDTRVYDYQYDEAGRLIGVDLDGINVETYDYDANGNRTSANGIVSVFDAQDRLTSFGTTTYDYTANGDLRERTDGADTTTYVYDVLGNLLQSTLEDDTVVDYVVDGQNRRVGKRVDGTLVQGWLYQDQINPIAELDGAGDVVSRFVYGTRLNVPDYMIRDGRTYRIAPDHLGSPRLVLDAETGEVVQRMDYDAFGQVTLDTNPGFQPFGFAGGLYDADTGLVRFGARDYDPEVGRWTVKDPLLYGGGINLYGYALSDPINLVDPLGLFCMSGKSRSTLIQGIAGAAGGAVTGAILGGVAGAAAGAVAGGATGVATAMLGNPGTATSAGIAAAAGVGEAAVGGGSRSGGAIGGAIGGAVGGKLGGTIGGAIGGFFDNGFRNPFSSVAKLAGSLRDAAKGGFAGLAGAIAGELTQAALENLISECEEECT